MRYVQMSGMMYKTEISRLSELSSCFSGQLLGQNITIIILPILMVSFCATQWCEQSSEKYLRSGLFVFYI